ncbi:MAG: lipopolysaccharide biosynthesis protein [Flavobacterium sp.]|uniref:lipopolysaccharide biosynthesis protein n=1 Tax=Flavobacterium sp. TaxID=239 RepID=UPI003BD11F60
MFLEIIPIFITGFMTMSLDQYLMRHYYEWDDNKKLINTIQVYRISLISSIFFFLFFLIITISTKSLLFDEKYFLLVILSLSNIFFISLYTVPFSVIRITNSPKNYFIVKVSTFFVYVISIYLTVYNFNLSLRGFYCSLIISNIFQFILLIFLQKNLFYILFKSNNNNLKLSEILRYTIPLIPTNIFGSLSSIFERVLLQKYVSSDIIGHYAIANKFAELINQLHGILKLSFGPNLFKTITTGGRQKVIDFAKSIKNYVFPLIFMFVFIYVTSDIAFEFIKLRGANLITKILNISLITVLINSTQAYIAPGLQIRKKTEIRFILELLLNVSTVLVIFLMLKNYNFFHMIIAKAIISGLYLLICYLLTINISDWKIDDIFFKKNIIYLCFLIFCKIYFNNHALNFFCFLSFIFINLKQVESMYHLIKKNNNTL